MIKLLERADTDSLHDLEEFAGCSCGIALEKVEDYQDKNGISWYEAFYKLHGHPQIIPDTGNVVNHSEINQRGARLARACIKRSKR